MLQSAHNSHLLATTLNINFLEGQVLRELLPLYISHHIDRDGLLVLFSSVILHLTSHIILMDSLQVSWDEFLLNLTIVWFEGNREWFGIRVRTTFLANNGNPESIEWHQLINS